MRITRWLVLVLVLLALASSSCAPRLIASPSLLGQAGTPAPTPSAWDFPRGRFSSVSAPNMVLLSIENDGRFRLFLDDVLLDSGSFGVSGAQVLVDSMTCAEHGDKAATYNWLYDAEEGLAFQPVADDPCPERRQYLSEQYQPKYAFVFEIPDRGVSRQWLW